MDKASGKLTVYFEEPFWVGVFERIEDGKLSVAKVTFGAEPKDYEVQEYIQKYYFSLKFSPAVETVVKINRAFPDALCFNHLLLWHEKSTLTCYWLKCCAIYNKIG